jgi:hypothetical protein
MVLWPLWAHIAIVPSNPSSSSWLRDELGDRFVAGVVLHTGTGVYPLGDRLLAAPICTLWA